MEYNSLLDMASTEKDPLRRLALIAIHQVSALSICERTTSKPFNPILGETYEYVTDDLQYLAEQVSHHPPVTACYCRGKAYSYHTNQKTNTKFSGKTLYFNQQYRVYVDLDEFGERYEIILPPFSAHNLIFGNMYIDIGDTMTVTNLTRPSEQALVKFERRSWLGKEMCKLTGEVFIGGMGKPDVFYEIAGNWNGGISLKNTKKGFTETVWVKKPYPPMWDHMYGMSRFSLQLNYFPKRLQNVVPPTDTRRRPDQRALEEGDMRTAAYEKDRLENRQRAVRKLMEAKKETQTPSYFEVWKNPHDGQDYWVYNKRYFEKDRPAQDWKHLPDIFSSTVTNELEPFLRAAGSKEEKQ